ncbi:unnamed protein product [Allacma fusca]|uniref:Uncharacterized protein n=1 Tax=Allacma fusca TaxID=39272 RepID=A0A8J2LEG0_9HEXA|nr:unnamed protein product [Allacma fusca]
MARDRKPNVLNGRESSKCQILFNGEKKKNRGRMSRAGFPLTETRLLSRDDHRPGKGVTFRNLFQINRNIPLDLFLVLKTAEFGAYQRLSTTCDSK